MTSSQPPRTRLDCLPGGHGPGGPGPNEARPCPWTACRHHIQATAQEGQSPGPSQTWSCVLDAVDARGAMGQYVVGDILGMSRQHVEYIERAALKKLLRADRRLGDVHQGWTGEEREPGPIPPVCPEDEDSRPSSPQPSRGSSSQGLETGALVDVVPD